MLNERETAKNISDRLNGFKGQDYYDNALEIGISGELDRGFQNATPSMGNVDISTEAGTLMITKKDNGVEQAYEIGTKIALYWASAIKPTGTPQGCRKIIAVANTALTIAEPIARDLLAFDHIANYSHDDHYLEFVKIIFKHIKTIVWTVAEGDSSPCGASFVVTVS